MKIVDIRELENEQLVDQLEASREELWKLRLAWHANTLENPNAMRLVRKDIARVLTVMRERQLAAELVQEEQDNE